MERNQGRCRCGAGAMPCRFSPAGRIESRLAPGQALLLGLETPAALLGVESRLSGTNSAMLY